MIPKNNEQLRRDKTYWEMRNAKTVREVKKHEDTVSNGRDKILMEDLDGMLSEVFGYPGYTILKCGLLSLSLDSPGYNIDCFAPDVKFFGKIIHKTHVSPISTHMVAVSLSESYFERSKEVDGEKYHLMRSFFIEIFINGLKQTFYRSDNKKFHMESKHDNMIGDVLFPSTARKMQKYYFTRNEYSRYLYYFTKGTASNIIISGRNLIYRKICLMLEDQITPYKIIKHYSENVLELQRSQYITSDEAIKKIKSQLIEYYSLHYLDYLYNPTEVFNYLMNIKNMLEDGITQRTFPSKRYSDALPISNFVKEFELVFDLGYFNDMELLQIAATSQFSYWNTQENRQKAYKPSWTLSVDSIFSKLEEPIIKTFDLLKDILDNCPAGVTHFSVHLYRAGPGGINEGVSLHTKIKELDSNRFTIDRSNPQSVLNGITSIIYYTLKYNALVVVKEGKVGGPTSNTVVCLNQLQIYHPDEVLSLRPSDDHTKVLNNYASSNYASWKSKFDALFNVGMVYPIYLFHDASAFGSRLSRFLRLFKNEALNIIKL